MNLFILMVLLARGITFSIFPPILPLEMEQLGYSLTYVGTIMAIASLSQLLFVNQYAEVSKGMKRSVLWYSSLFYGLNMLGFSFINLFKPSEPVYVLVCIALRLL